ncbi:MAG: PilZ domain-containing protein, partial [Magnetococcus sp. WYHC-3]
FVRAAAQHRDITGEFLFTRLASLASEAAALPASSASRVGNVGMPSPQDPRHQNPLVGALAEFDRKLDFLLAGVLPPASRQTLAPARLPVLFSSQAILFWDVDPGIKKGDYVEIQFSPQRQAPFLMRCYAQVTEILPDPQRQATRVTCRIETMDNFSWKRLKEQLIPKTAPAKPTPAPPAAPAPEAENARPTNSQRQSYRVNDEIPFGWHTIPDKVLEAHIKEFERSHELCTCSIMAEYPTVAMALNREISAMKSMNSKVLKLMVWFQKQIEILFQRSNRFSQKQTLLAMLRQMGEISHTLISLGRIPPKAVDLFTHWKYRLEWLQKLAAPEVQDHPSQLQELRDNLAKLDALLPPLVGEMERLAPAAAESIRAFDNHLGQMDLMQWDMPGPLDGPGQVLLHYPVNLSSTGIAFRTRTSQVKKDDLVEMRMELLDAQGKTDTFRALSRVVVVMPPSKEEGRYRVACQFILLPNRTRDALEAHVIYKQRKEIGRRGG